MFSKIKKNIWFFLLILLLLPAIWPLFKDGFFNADDAVWHISRLWQFHLSFSSGQIPVRWAPTLFYGLGYPAFVFNFHLPYYLMEVTYQLGFGLVDSYKIVLGLSIFASGLFAYLFLRSIFFTLPAVVGSLFFVYSPYRFATVYSRGAIGEALAIALVPLIFWQLEFLRKGGKYSGPFLALSIFLIIISNPLIFLMFAPMILLYLLMFSEKHVNGIFWFLIGCLASSFAILPYFIERKYLMVDEFTKTAYLGHFPNLFSVFRVPLANADLNTPFQIGIVNWLVVLIVVISLLKFEDHTKKNLNILIKFSIIFFVVGIILMGSFSSILWEKLPFLSTILYPWRFINLLVLTSSVCAAFLIHRLKSNLIISLTLMVSVLFVSRHWWGWVGQIPKDDYYYQNYEDTNISGLEFAPKGWSPQAIDLLDKNVEIVMGQGEITHQTVKSNRWEFGIKSASDSFVKLSLLNFPGWQVAYNGNITPIVSNFTTLKNDYSGLVVLGLPPGEHKVKVVFGETPVRKIGNYLSLICLLLIFFRILQLRFLQNLKEN